MSTMFSRGDGVQALDVESGVWRTATILDVGEEDYLIHYDTWSHKFDEKLRHCQIRANSIEKELGKCKRANETHVIKSTVLQGNVM